MHCICISLLKCYASKSIRKVVILSLVIKYATVFYHYTVIDCFDGNNLMFQVRASVIQMLPSAEISDLPVVVKFILQSVGDNDAFEVQYT